MARYRSNENATIVRTDEYEALQTIIRNQSLINHVYLPIFMLPPNLQLGDVGAHLAEHLPLEVRVLVPELDELRWQT